MFRVRDILAKHEGPRGLKATAIHLWRNERHQLDVMLTLHVAPKARDGVSKNQAWLYEATNQSLALREFCHHVGLTPILRTKIEADLEAEDPTDLTPVYFEVHTRSPNLTGTEDDPQSENLLQSRKGLFLTHRSESKEEAEAFVQDILRRDPDSEVWREMVLMDTCPGLDAWWCPIKT